MGLFVVFICIVLLLGCVKETVILDNVAESPEPSQITGERVNQDQGCAEDLKTCPDGSTVSRVLPSCDFASCGGCTDQCGDGICQEIACQGEGCPCIENEQICSQDCSSKDIADIAGGDTIK